MVYISLFLVGVFVSPCMAEDQTITLKDGSQIKGNLVGINGGTYTIHTPALGDVKVGSDQVSSITNGAAPAPSLPASSGQAPFANSNNDFNQRIQSAQSKLMSDPAMMQQVAMMTQDPDLMKLLSDPSLTQAIMSHDPNAISSNPKAKELMNNPKIKALIDQLYNKGYTK